MERVREELRRKESSKEELLRVTKKIVSLCGLCIIETHRGNVKRAISALREAEGLEKDLKNMLEEDSSNWGHSQVTLAYQELNEARLLYHLVTEGRLIPYDGSLGPAESYVLGLSDVVGELRRIAVESLRKGDVKKAEDTFKIMEKVYGDLMETLSAAPSLGPLRRKCDVLRGVLESTRGSIATEARRLKVEEQMVRLEKVLEELNAAVNREKGVR